MERTPKRVSDGFVSCERGIDSGKNPSLQTEINPIGLSRNQFSFAVNCTMRGGRANPRPGFKKNSIADFALKTGRFQGAAYYKADNDPGCIIASISGHIIRFNVGADNSVEDITIPGDANPGSRPQVWMYQAENYLIIQDGQSKPLIYNGGTLRRAKYDEVPTGTVGTYGIGRIWQTLPGGTTFAAGDLVGSPSGTAIENFRDAVLKFTENTFLNEGGTFSVPSNAGSINAMRFVVNLDTSLGQGPLQVFTSNTVFSVNAPADRTLWKAVTYPIQTISMVSYGALSQASTTIVNGDVFYRSSDGVRSFIIARRNFGQWGNTPQSSEMNRVLQFDDDEFLYASSSEVYDNRLLMTCSPVHSANGIYHRGLMSLDFNLISSMGEKYPPAWEGLWTGLNILQIVKGNIGGTERLFIFSLNADNEIDLWEMTKDSRFDLVPDEKRITWSFETASFPFGDIFGLKRLRSGDLWVDRLAGEVEFTLMYKPDLHPCWQPWLTWTECGKYEDCDIDTCSTPEVFKEQIRPKMKFTQPPETCDTITGRPFTDMYECQGRLQITGYCSVKQMRLHAVTRDESEFDGCLA